MKYFLDEQIFIVLDCFEVTWSDLMAGHVEINKYAIN